MQQSMNEPELMSLADLNLVQYWCDSAQWLPDTEVFHSRDTVFINSALSSPACSLAFNLAMNSKEQPDDFLTRIKTFFKARKRGFSLILRGHEDRKIIQYCKDTNIFLIDDQPGMVLDAPINERSMPDGAQLHWVDNENELQCFKQVVSEAYLDLAFPSEVSGGYFTYRERVLSPYSIMAVVYLEEEPVCTAMAMLTHGIAGIYWVGTVKKARGKGLASYCTREVGNKAFALGARKVILQASKFGAPVYKKMGYREFTRYPWFFCSSE